MTACQETSAVDGATAELELPTALERAANLGRFLIPIIEEIRIAEETSVLGGVDALCEALDVVLGAASTEMSADLRVIDGALAYAPGQCNGLADVAAADARLALNIQSLEPLFFYEYTLIDVSTGMLYQSCRGVNTGCDTALLEFFGPLVPPQDGQLIGDFDADGRRALEDAVRDAVEGG